MAGVRSMAVICILVPRSPILGQLDICGGYTKAGRLTAYEKCQCVENRAKLIMFSQVFGFGRNCSVNVKVKNMGICCSIGGDKWARVFLVHLCPSRLLSQSTFPNFE